MKKKLLALALAALMACSAVPALAAEAEITCEVLLDGSLQVNVPSQRFSGKGAVQIATYSAEGRILDFQSIDVEDLRSGYSDIVSMKTEMGGACKAFVLDGNGYQPLGEHGRSRRIAPVLLKTLTRGADFGARPTTVWDSAYPEDYVGVEAMEDTSRIKFYVNSDYQGTQAVSANAGDVARLYDTDGDGKADTVDISRYRVARVAGRVYTQQNASGVEMAMIPGVTSGYIPVSQIQGPYARVEQGDVLLYHTDNMYNRISDESLFTFEIAQSVTGKVTAVGEDGRLTLNSKTYESTGIMGGSRCYADMLARWDDLENEYTFYLDKNGGICAYDSIIADNTAVVLESAWVPDATLEDGGYMQAKLLLASGDVVITPIDRIGVALDGGIVMCTPSGEDETADGENQRVSYWDIPGMSGTAGGLDGTLDFNDGFWSYRVNGKDHYEITNRNLKEKDFAPETVIAPHQNVVSKPQFTPGSYANNSTLFLVEKVNEDNTSIFTTYVGYNNVPAMDAEDMLGGVGIRRRDATAGSLVDPFARYVYLKTKGFAEPAPTPVEPKPTPKDLPEGLTFRVDSQYSRSNGNYIINVLDPKTGDRTALEVDDLSYVSDALEMYTVDAVSDRVVTAMTAVTQSDTEKGLTVGTLERIGAHVVTFKNSNGSNGRRFQYDEDTICILIDLVPNVSAGKLVYSFSGMFDPEELDLDTRVYQPDPELYVIADQDDFAHYIYVVRTLKAN